MSDLSMAGKLVAGLLLMGSVAVWAAIVDRCRRGDAPVPWQPREACSWQAWAVAMALPASILVEFIALSGLTDKSPPLVLAQARCLAAVLEIFVLLGMLAVGTPIRASDFGLHRSGLADDVRFGVFGFLAALMPVYAVNYVVWRLGLRAEGEKHAFLKALEGSPPSELVWWIVLSAVVLAPLVEELLYRVVLQGWLETRLPPRAAILFASFLFASVHPRGHDYLPLFPLALILGYVYHRRHSYLTVVVMHATFNATNLVFATLFFGK